MNKVSEESVLSLPERHARILALLQQNGSISVTQLAEQFRVSEVTIRKDLSYLEQQKTLYRTHGSAILLSPYISDRHVSEKEKGNVEEKLAIGKAAAELIEQNDSIIIASGTTMTFLAREIRPAGRLTVITASVPVTQILSQNEQTDVIQLGGITRSSSVSVVGPFAEQMIRSFYSRKLFIGVCGIDPDFYACRERPDGEMFPWEHLDAGVSREFLLREWKKAQNAERTQDCRKGCVGCGMRRYEGACR